MAGSRSFSRSGEPGRKFGVHEVVLMAGPGAADHPFEVDCTVTFTPPSGNAKTVFAFYDGSDTWRARCYLAEEGAWRWASECAACPELRGRGTFTVAASSLRGMLHPHPENPRQWATDGGRWFLNLNDTAYFFFNASKSLWQDYVIDAASRGITSLRAAALGHPGWFHREHPQSDAPDTTNAPWVETAHNTFDYTRYDLAKFQTTDQRLAWCLEHVPEVYFQLILFGKAAPWGKDDADVCPACPLA